MNKQMVQLVIASRNVHKIREYKEMLKVFPSLDVLSLLDFPDYKPSLEIADSFEQNALTKAKEAFQALNRVVLADDSGLVIPALNGEPGIFSARYAGNDATDADNRKKLLSKMEMLKDDERNGFFTCCIAIASFDGINKTFCATCEGIIIKKEKGGSGFGYDSLFVKNDYNKTFAELDSSIKNKISHRRKAFDKLVPFLETLIS